MELLKINQKLLDELLLELPKKANVSDTSIEKSSRKLRSDRIHIIICYLNQAQVQYVLDFVNKHTLRFLLLPLSNYRILIDIYEPINLDQL